MPTEFKIDTDLRTQIQEMKQNLSDYILDTDTLNIHKTAVDYILNHLDTRDQNLLLLWYILGCNCRKLSNYLNISQPIILREIKNIKKKIICFSKSYLSK